MLRRGLRLRLLRSSATWLDCHCLDKSRDQKYVERWTWENNHGRLDPMELDESILYESILYTHFRLFP